MNKEIKNELVSQIEGSDGSETETTEYTLKEIYENFKDELYNEIYNDLIRDKSNLYKTKILAKIKLNLMNFKKIYVNMHDKKEYETNSDFTVDFMGFNLNESTVHLKNYSNDYITFIVELPNSMSFSITIDAIDDEDLNKKKYTEMTKLHEQLRDKIFQHFQETEKQTQTTKIIPKKFFESKKEEVIQKLKELYKISDDAQKKYIIISLTRIQLNDYRITSSNEINLYNFDISDAKFQKVDVVKSYDDIDVNIYYSLPNTNEIFVRVTVDYSSKYMKKEKLEEYKQKLKEIFCDLESEKILSL